MAYAGLPYDPWANQPDDRGDVDLGRDPALVDYAGGAPTTAATARWLGRAATREMARAAERHPPELRLVDRGGRRLDRVEFHPAYHDLLGAGLAAGYAAGPWTGGRHVDHAALVYLFSQVEPGVACPMTMTYAAVPAIDADPGLAATWRPKLTAADYDPAVAPVGAKRAATLGMAMTERQGGSDVRANVTTAAPADGAWRLDGHKWFCSAPMSDAFLTLARTAEGLTCFLVPRWREDGPNGIRIVRLKEKLGNRANASAEIEYHGATAHRLGEAGDGVRRIIEMVHHTRLDTAMAPAGLMRAALTEAHHWVAHRTAFQRRLIDQPLMRTLLADLALDWEGATALGFRVAAAFDDPDQRAFARVAVALAKYLSNARCPQVTFEAMQVLGGMGYVEDTPMPTLYREAPLNGIWEGSGNVICLDILRTLAREPAAREALAGELEAGRGVPTYDAALDDWLAAPAPDEAGARWFAERTATLLTASVLNRQAPDAVAHAYAATRLGERRGLTSGAVAGVDPDALLPRLGPSE